MSNPNKKKQIIKTVLILLIICGLGGGGYFTYSKYKQTQAKAAMAEKRSSVNKTQKVTKSDISSIISTTGSVAAQKEYTISLTATQDISKVLVNVGDEVKEGQSLIEYDLDSSKESLEKNLRDAKLSLANAQLNLKTYNLPATDKEIAAFKNAISSAENALYKANLDLDNNTSKISDAKKDVETAKTDLDNNKKLYDIGAISKQDYDKSNDAYETAVKTLSDLQAQQKNYEHSITTAQYNLDKAKNDLDDAINPTMDTATEVKYEQQKLNIESAQIKIEDLQSQIDDLKDVSTSPANGVVISKSVEDGDVAKESTELLKVADVTKLIVDATVSEYEASQIVIGQNVKITSDGIADKIYTGKVISIDPTAASNGSEVVVPIEVSIDNSDSSLRPGYTVDLEITTADAKGVLCVPIASILTEASKSETKKYVFIVDQNKTLKKSYVTTGVSGDMNVEIKEGLNEGDEVIASPSSSLKEGQSLDSVPSVSSSSKGENQNAQNSGFMQGVPTGGPTGGGSRQGGPGGF